MDFNTTPRPRQSSFINSLHLVREVGRLAKQRGLHGDALGREPPTGTMAQEFAALGLFLDLPTRARRAAPDRAWELCRAVAMGGPRP